MNAIPKERRNYAALAPQHYQALFKKALLQLITEPDPYLAMLNQVMTEMMWIEPEAKAEAAKGKQTKERTTHLPGGRAGTMFRMCFKSE